VQETFIKAFSAIQNFRGECCLFSWLYRIALNSAYSAVRAKKQNLLTVSLSDQYKENAEALADLTWAADTPLAVLQANQLLDAMNSRLSSMPEQLAHVFILREIDGLSYDDIAATMRCAVGTVRSRLFRARQLVSPPID
jgi:RNA polymerase sigma-70 factor (ECF subfamily)